MKVTIKTPLFINELGQRPNQEDSIYPSPGTGARHDRLFIVCDGMGGYAGGEIASNAVVSALGQWFMKNSAPGEQFTEEALNFAIDEAYTALNTTPTSNTKMGTTLALLYFHSGGCMAAHIGDSRIYHIRPSRNQLLYKSRDHSQTREAVAGGKKNVLTRAMVPNATSRCYADVAKITDIKAGDYFFLCSDGMLENMRDEELVDIIAKGSDDRGKISNLIAVTRDNRDNHSAYLICVESVTNEIGDEGLISTEKEMSDIISPMLQGAAFTTAFTQSPQNDYPTTEIALDAVEERVPDREPSYPPQVPREPQRQNNAVRRPMPSSSQKSVAVSKAEKQNNMMKYILIGLLAALVILLGVFVITQFTGKDDNSQPQQQSTPSDTEQVVEGQQSNVNVNNAGGGATQQRTVVRTTTTRSSSNARSNKPTPSKPTPTAAQQNNGGGKIDRQTVQDAVHQSRSSHPLSNQGGNNNGNSNNNQNRHGNNAVQPRNDRPVVP